MKNAFNKAKNASAKEYRDKSIGASRGFQDMAKKKKKKGGK